MKSNEHAPLPSTYVEIGKVYICRDSADVIIQTDNMGKKLQRVMVTCEFVELMEPTQPCWQFNMEQQIKEHPDLLSFFTKYPSPFLRHD